MADIEIHIDVDGRTRPVGVVRSSKMQGSETVFFEYAPAWLIDPYRFAPLA
jgi:serine/threonine-protein kinase HipA